MILSAHIALFKSLFKGREDVFAIRWEKGAKKGYMPAYHYDPHLYRAHTMRGGNFQNFTDKTFLPFKDEQIAKHLNGGHHAGVYPLLADNTSWFIVADFDKENWIDECRTFLNACAEKQIPAYLERSRSGKGGHVWIFFEQPYPAFKSRQIVLSLLTGAGIISRFDKNSSFDRLFPNQDTLSGKGLGNLIALPLYNPTLQQGNSCFIDTETLLPFADQWTYLGSIQKISFDKLEILFDELSVDQPITTPRQETNGKLRIDLNQQIQLNRNAVPLSLINFLKEELNFISTEFLIKKKAGRNTFGTEHYFKCIEEIGNNIIIPKGFIGKLLRYCKSSNIEYSFEDNRNKPGYTAYQFNAILRPHQATAMDVIARKDMGVIVAPPGSGKTVIALKLIAEKQQPALIVVHRKQLMEQWIERIETFLSIPKKILAKLVRANQP